MEIGVASKEMFLRFGSGKEIKLTEMEFAELEDEIIDGAVQRGEIARIEEANDRFKTKGGVL